MSRKGNVQPKIGRVIKRDPRVREVQAACSCGAVQSVPVDSTLDLDSQIADESCLFCGRFGMLRAVTAA